MAKVDIIGIYAEPRRVLELLLDKLNIDIVDCRSDVKLTRSGHANIYIDANTGNRASNAERLASGLANMALGHDDSD